MSLRVRQKCQGELYSLRKTENGKLYCLDAAVLSSMRLSVLLDCTPSYASQRKWLAEQRGLVGYWESDTHFVWRDDDLLGSFRQTFHERMLVVPPGAEGLVSPHLDPQQYGVLYLSHLPHFPRSISPSTPHVLQLYDETFLVRAVKYERARMRETLFERL